MSGLDTVAGDTSPALHPCIPTTLPTERSPRPSTLFTTVLRLCLHELASGQGGVWLSFQHSEAEPGGPPVCGGPGLYSLC